MGLITAEDLAVGHGRRALAQEISFDLARGEVLCLLGPNGAGKTTLLRTLLGLLAPVAGRVLVGGVPAGDLSRAAIARQIAFVPQALSAPFAYTALDVVLMARTARLGPFARPGRRDLAAAERALATLGIADLAQRPITELSGGQRQLVLIARALAQETPTLILDEPAASLDYGNRLRLLARLETLAAAGHGLIVSTHEPEHARRIANRVLTLDAQGLVRLGDPHDLLTPDRIALLYGIPPAELVALSRVTGSRCGAPG